MDKKIIKILIPIVAILVIVESLISMGKFSTKKIVVDTEIEQQVVAQPITMKWVGATVGQVGKSGEVSLLVSSDKDLAVDAIDLYVQFDPNLVEMSDYGSGTKFVVPSFKKINSEKGMVVMNYLVSDPKGFEFKTGQEVEIARFKVGYKNQGQARLSLNESTLVVENTSAKMLPFNGDELDINISR